MYSKTIDLPNFTLHFSKLRLLTIKVASRLRAQAKMTIRYINKQINNFKYLCGNLASQKFIHLSFVSLMNQLTIILSFTTSIKACTTHSSSSSLSISNHSLKYFIFCKVFCLKLIFIKFFNIWEINVLAYKYIILFVRVQKSL